MGIDHTQFSFGTLPKGKRNLLTDVPGVTVGHFTRSGGSIQTGVTAILPHKGNVFDEKLLAAVHVINGFGKSTGLIQIRELGTLESPILLTNTFSVAAATEGILDYMLPRNPAVGVTTGTINTVVLECNDGKLNDIRGRHIRPEDALQAIEGCAASFEEGAVGGGRGMICYGLKGGIGSASRVIAINGISYTVGALVMTNFGAAGDLTVCGRKISVPESDQADKGSVIIVLATDAPLSARQLERCARRAQNGLARTGSITGTGSGEIALMFSTANRIHHYDGQKMLELSFLHEDNIDHLFRAVAESVEESVISSLYHAETVTGFNGTCVRSLSDAKLL